LDPEKENEAGNGRDGMGESVWVDRQFEWNERLGICVPSLKEDWETIGRSRRIALLERWETVRGSIPDRVNRLEERINVKQDELSLEDDFRESCRLNADIAELASRINDLHIWYRTQQDLEEESKRHG
jgi:hypothetical protein